MHTHNLSFSVCLFTHTLAIVKSEQAKNLNLNFLFEQLFIFVANPLKRTF
jgi:hypothetical protein